MVEWVILWDSPGMSVQIFLQGKLLGIEDFLVAPVTGAAAPGDAVTAGRAYWVTLLAEVLPRALLAELGLAKILLGTSGGGHFLVVLPDESRPLAEEFLAAAAEGISGLSGGLLRLAWAITENLGDWSDVRKRLNEAMTRKRGTPASGAGRGFFDPLPLETPVAANSYFADLAARFREASQVGWSPDTPAQPLLGAGKHSWPLDSPAEGISVARHTAPSDDSTTFAGLDAFAARAAGRAVWGVLRGDVDDFGIRLRRAQSIEEHIQLSLMYKQFFAGELEVVCSMPEFWRKVTILYSGGDDFAVYGSWDALVALAREVHRLFRRFAEEHLKDFPGPEGKTVSMALALAPGQEASLAWVYAEAGQLLERAKSVDKDCFHLLGRTLEWKQVADAAEIQETIRRLIVDYGCPPRMIDELAAFYRESPWGAERQGRSREGRVERPWRLHWRINRLVGPTRDREFQRLRMSLITDLVGKSAAQARLRSSGRVALEWARLQTEV